MKRSSFLLALTVAIAVTGLSIALTRQAQAQGGVISQLSSQLSQQGVPIKEVKQSSLIPFRIEVTIQSTSTANTAAPEDASFEQLVRRDTAMLQQRDNIKIDRLKVTDVNALGTVIYWTESVVNAPQDLPPSKHDDASVAALIKGQLDPFGMTVDKIDVTTDVISVRSVTFDLSVTSIEQANSGLSLFIPGLEVLMDKLNSDQSTQIGLYNVNVTGAAAHPLLKYVRDIQLGQQRWWQADGLMTDWYPQVTVTPTPSP